MMATPAGNGLETVVDGVMARNSTAVEVAPANSDQDEIPAIASVPTAVVVQFFARVVDPEMRAGSRLTETEAVASPRPPRALVAYPPVRPVRVAVARASIAVPVT